MHILDTLKERGILAQITFEDELYKQLEREPTTFYVGFDPTASSLHFGHFIPIIAMIHMQRAGHRPIALVGGGTAMVGDPSGRTDMRKMMTLETITKNIEGIRAQLGRFIDFTDQKAIMVNNADWLHQLNYLDFLRDVGVHFSVNRMLTAECYKQRYERGLTFLEFNYMLMQAYDFYRLFKDHGCRLEMGGDDQWSNMLAGADLIRRKEGEAAFACTFKLLLNSEGKKMGKTEKGALWLDSELCTPYDFYQYWRNIDDADVASCLGMLTFLPMDEVRKLSKLEGSAINEAKQVLAFECTRLVHGIDEAEKAQLAAKALFGTAGKETDNLPTYCLTSQDLDTDSRLISILAQCGLCSSKSDARKMIEQGAVLMNGDRATDIDCRVTAAQLENDGLLLRKGKKNYCKILLRR